MRKFMVVMDDSSEFLNALYYSALRAEKTGGGVVMLSVVSDQDFSHWIGVGDAMREEARENIEAHFEVFRKWMEGKVEIKPELVIRYGDKTKEILAAVADDPEIGVMVLGAGSGGKGPGPLIEDLVVKRGGDMPVPVVIVPGKMSRENIAMIA